MSGLSSCGECARPGSTTSLAPAMSSSTVQASGDAGGTVVMQADQGAVVATNPALLFFGVQRSGEAAKLQRAFHLSRHQRAFLESARRGDFLLAAGMERLAVEVQAPPWQEEAMRVARHQARLPVGTR